MRPTTRVDYIDRIRRVLRHVQQHLDDDLSPGDLADLACFSRFHFHRVFSGLLGESVSDHVRRLRLERAAGELRRTGHKVIDVALAAGYEAHQPFTRAFRAHFGMSPSDYRSAAEPIAFPPALCAVHYGADQAVSRFVPLVEDSRMIEVRIESLPRRRLLATEHHGDYLAIGEAFERLDAVAIARALTGPDAVSLGIFYDDPDVTSVERLRSHACLTIPQDFPAPAGFEILALPGGEHAVGVHRGPYALLHESYRWLFGQWLPASSRAPANRPCHEIYVNDPRSVRPEELITLICLPLEPAAATPD